MSDQFIFVYPVFQWGNIVGKVLPKAGGSEKIKKGNGHIGGAYRSGGFKPFAHYEQNPRIDHEFFGPIGKTIAYLESMTHWVSPIYYGGMDGFTKC